MLIDISTVLFTAIIFIVITRLKAVSLENETLGVKVRALEHMLSELADR
jgi:hypothetical protein